MTDTIAGTVDPAFQPVADAFAKNFSERGELGAALSVVINGKTVVDIWGGERTKRSADTPSDPWQRDTLVGFYSVGKPLSALCLLQLIDQGRISLDSPVSHYWPEFEANGKADVTMRHILSHQSGLPAVREKLPEGAMLDWPLMIEKLAATEPWFEPGSQSVYHTNTYGYLVGEPVRRLTGLSIGEYFNRYIAEPINADVFFGVKEQNLPRVADTNWHPSGAAPDPHILDMASTEEERMEAYSYFNPSGLSSLGVMNTPAWRRAEIPSTNGQGTARGVAKIYHVLAQGGSYNDVTLLSPELLAEATRVQWQGLCPILKREASFGLGFQITRPDRPFGTNPHSFGHFGSGGSLGFADPDLKLGFGYVINDVIPRWQSDRNKALIDALYQCV